MAFIYIGSLYPPHMIEELKGLHSSIDYAAETFQTSLVNGFISHCSDLKIITAPNVSSFPRISKAFFAKRYFQYNGLNGEHVFTGFVNIPILKHLSKSLRILKAIHQLSDSDTTNSIVVYGVHSPFLLPVLAMKKKRKLKVSLIVPDLPEYMSGNKSFLFLLAKKFDRCLINMCLRTVDTFVLFSPHMAEKLPVNGHPWIHLEGILDRSNIVQDSYPKDENKVILYTGNLSERMGITNLLEAFSKIPFPNYRLWIRGAGECRQKVREASQIDDRIVYFEQMSKRELLALQKKATILINPVFASETFTRYFFPSKTMEYLSSGTPTVMSHLACIPKEYDKHIYYFDEDSVDGIKNKIIEICEKPQEELMTFGKAAADFIHTEKNEVKQAGRVLKLLEL